MKSSAIVDPRTDPLSLLVVGPYAELTESALEAYALTGNYSVLGRIDTTVHEFIGDKNYLDYLGGSR